MNKLYEYIIDLTVVNKKASSGNAKKFEHSWSSINEITVNAVNLLQDKSGCIISDNTIVSSEEFKKDDTAYMVFIGWGSGDSFGSSVNSDYMGVHLFKDEVLARILFEKIWLNYICVKDNRNTMLDIDMMDFDGIDYLIDNSNVMRLNTVDWSGYFERITLLSIYKVKIGNTLEQISSIDYDVSFDADVVQENLKKLQILFEKNNINKTIKKTLDKPKTIKI